MDNRIEYPIIQKGVDDSLENISTVLSVFDTDRCSYKSLYDNFSEQVIALISNGIEKQQLPFRYQDIQESCPDNNQLLPQACHQRIRRGIQLQGQDFPIADAWRKRPQLLHFPARQTLRLNFNISALEF